jgi:hypothetical protein
VIFDLGSFGNFVYFGKPHAKAQRRQEGIGAPLQGAKVRGTWHSEGDALGYYGTGLRPAYLAMIVSQSFGHFTMGIGKKGR